MIKIIITFLLLSSSLYAQSQGTWVSGGGGDTTGIVHNAIRIKGVYVTLIPPTDNFILKYDSAGDSLLFEVDDTGSGGQWTDFGTFLKPIDDADVALHLGDTADNDSLIIAIDGSGNITFTTTTGNIIWTTGNTGNDAFQLPASSVSSTEILNATIQGEDFQTGAIDSIGKLGDGLWNSAAVATFASGADTVLFRDATNGNIVKGVISTGGGSIDSVFTSITVDSIENRTNVSTTSIIVTDSIRFQDHAVFTTSDLDTFIIALDGVSATNSFTAGTRFFLYMDGATEIFAIDTTGALVAGSISTSFGAIDVGGSAIAGGSFDASDGNIANVGQLDVDTIIGDGATLVFGDDSETIQVNSSDWDISTTGAMTGFSFDANGTGNSLSNVDLTADITGTLPIANGGTNATTLDDIIGGTAITVTAGANTVIAGNATIAVTAGGIGTTEIGTDGVSADELNATGVEAELEAVLDLPELQGLLISTQVDSVGGNGIVTHTQLAEYDTIMVELNAAAWDTTSSTGKATSLAFNSSTGFAEGYWSFAASTADSLIISFDLPDFFSSFVRIQVVIEGEDTTADTLFLHGEGFADDENHALDVALASAAATFEFDTVTANNDLNETEDFSIVGTYAAGDHMHFLLRRAATDQGITRFISMKVYVLRTL